MHFRRRNDRSAFTFVEVVVVVIIIGILAAMVIPRFGAVTDDAKTAAVQGTVAGVRSSIAGFRSARLLAGGNPFPTLNELTTAGTVLDQTLPANPFTGIGGVQAVSASAATSRTVINPGLYGWNYYVDNSASPPKAVFYPNSNSPTTAKDANGTNLIASKL